MSIQNMNVEKSASGREDAPSKVDPRLQKLAEVMDLLDRIDTVVNESEPNIDHLIATLGDAYDTLNSIRAALAKTPAP